MLQLREQFDLQLLCFSYRMVVSFYGFSSVVWAVKLYINFLLLCRSEAYTPRTINVRPDISGRVPKSKDFHT
jgi:hypothetical protein